MLPRRDDILGGRAPAALSAAAPVALRPPAKRRSTALATTATAVLATTVLSNAVLATAVLATAVLATAMLSPPRSRRVGKQSTPAPWTTVPSSVKSTRPTVVFPVRSDVARHLPRRNTPVADISQMHGLCHEPISRENPSGPVLPIKRDCKHAESALSLLWAGTKFLLRGCIAWCRKKSCCSLLLVRATRALLDCDACR